MMNLVVAVSRYNYDREGFMAVPLYKFCENVKNHWQWVGFKL